VLNRVDPCPLQDQALVDWNRGEPTGVDPGRDLASLILAQHFCNFRLWKLENESRRKDVDDKHIADVKRSIDRWNQSRNDLIERIDETLLAQSPSADPAASEQHSETAGQIIDRLSILGLKVWHMRRRGRTQDHEQARECAAKAEILETQRTDLARCLDRLLEDIRVGRRFFRLYRQFKSYGEPEQKGHKTCG